MKIQYISDIHLEYHSTLPNIDQISDILVLAGDIGFPFSLIYKEFLIDMNKKFKKIFLIAGNHEFYSIGKNRDKSMEEIEDGIKSIIIDNNLDNISYLDNSYEDYQGFRFCGTTLWTQIKDQNYLTNDFKYIQNMNIEFRNELYEINCEFIEDMIKNSNLPIIMITHHLPSFKLIHSEYRTEEYSNFNQCYAGECEQYFKENIKVWIYGHTHKENNTEINNIKFVCNPKGYPDENIKIKDFNRIVEI